MSPCPAEKLLVAALQGCHGWCTLEPPAAVINCTQSAQNCTYLVIEVGGAHGPTFPWGLTQLVVDGKGNFLQGVAAGKVSMSLQTTLMKLIGHTLKRK